MGRIKSLFQPKRKAKLSRDDIQAIFRTKYVNFKILLDSNSELLKIISEIEEKLRGETVFGMSFVRSQTLRALFHAGRMIRSFESLSGRSFPTLSEVLDQIHHIIQQEQDIQPAQKTSEYILPYDQITKKMTESVGGKSANLGEIMNHVHLPIPRGFAITTTAFEGFIQSKGLVEEIRKRKMELDIIAPETIVSVSESIQQLLTQAELPEEIESAILNAYHLVFDSIPKPFFVALRSSAIGEDSQMSFAGQYLSVLNVPQENIIQEYKRVIASLFTARAISYRQHMGIPFEDAAMSVACLEMVPANVSGVMYSSHPFTHEDNIIIQAVWGLGPYVVDGIITPDSYTLSKCDPPQILEMKTSCKSVKLVSGKKGYLVEEPVDVDLQNQPCLTREQASLLASYALRLETHFQCPQDIEWAINADGRIRILQTRPLRKNQINAEGCLTSSELLPGHTVILEGGSVASPGVGYGPAYHVRSEADLMAFPEGGILIASYSYPQYVLVMQKAQALVTDFGSITGHMASLAREFKVPALLNTKTATTSIEHGEIITVDAYSGRVYQGKVDKLLEMRIEKKWFMQDTPVYNLLRKRADLILPLNLVDPKSAQFIPDNCKTIHDIMRYIHEKSYGEVFQISDMASDRGSMSVRLKARLPLDLYIIDLGNGMSEDAFQSSTVTVDQITSVPFNALLRGMLRKDLKAMEPRPIELKGLFSVMSQQMLAPPNRNTERFGDKSYAIISDKYLNFSSRVGYHYSILDTYCGQTPTKNYINFQFKGGAADDVRKNRRVRAIEKILGALGFLVESQGDRVTARFAKEQPAVIEEKLDYIGRLLLFTRQMDMLMTTESSVNHLAECFLQGNYSLEPKG
ncbi:MAG: phosphoenolpyruvate synthase [Deltaproteobacteria bacterium]|nr:phosphoenolpyruvate synthase [Deltaproteobacteria bacterium]